MRPLDNIIPDNKANNNPIIKQCLYSDDFVLYNGEYIKSKDFYDLYYPKLRSEEELLKYIIK